MKSEWYNHIQTKEEYDQFVNSGFGWELFWDMPLTWQECEDFLKKYNYVKETRQSNYQASMALEGIVKQEEENSYERSSN